MRNNTAFLLSFAFGAALFIYEAPPYVGGILLLFCILSVWHYRVQKRIHALNPPPTIGDVRATLLSAQQTVDDSLEMIRGEQ